MKAAYITLYTIGAFLLGVHFFQIFITGYGTIKSIGAEEIIAVLVLAVATRMLFAPEGGQQPTEQ